MGDFQIFTMTFSALANPYALEGEDILGELLQILEDCLFDPNVENGGFSETEYNIKTKDLLDTIDAEINNKRGYAIRQGEPAFHSCYGTREDVLALTPQITYEAYQELLRTASIEIYFVGAESQPRIVPFLSRIFAQVQRVSETTPFSNTPSPLKTEPEIRTEQMNVAQCKMAMVFKTDYTDFYTINLMNFLFSVTPFSLLFTNVREKLSLCYYCSGSYNESKQALFVDCGIEKSNIQKAKDEILHQLEAVQKGDFSDELLENARISIVNALHGIGDTPSSYIRWYFSELTRGSSKTPQEAAETYQAVTREMIMEAARAFRLDCIYIMEANGEEDAVNE